MHLGKKLSTGIVSDDEPASVAGEEDLPQEGSNAGAEHAAPEPEPADAG